MRSGPNGAILEIDGKFEALRCSGLPEKLVFDRVPDGLTDTPTLTVRTLAPVAGHYTVTLSYIATGLNWSADYVARIEPDSNKLDLSGWLTLANFSATGFSNAPVDVVAGNCRRPATTNPSKRGRKCWQRIAGRRVSIGRRIHYPPPPPPPPPAPMSAALRARLAGGNMAEMTVQATPVTIDARTLGDYKLYPLPEPTTVAAQQTKQIQFLDQSGVPFERIYRYSIDGAPNPEALPKTANVILRLQNRRRQGLG